MQIIWSEIGRNVVKDVHYTLMQCFGDIGDWKEKYLYYGRKMHLIKAKVGIFDEKIKKYNKKWHIHVLAPSRHDNFNKFIRFK